MDRVIVRCAGCDQRYEQKKVEGIAWPPAQCGLCASTDIEVEALGEVKRRLDAWAAERGGELALQAAGEYAYEDSLVREIAKVIAGIYKGRVGDCLSFVLQEGDGERQRFKWEKRKAPNAAAFEVVKQAEQSVGMLLVCYDKAPPDLRATVLPIMRVSEEHARAGGTEVEFYTAVLVELSHPCARTAYLVLPTEEV